MSYSWELLEKTYEACLNLPEDQREKYILETCRDNEEIKNTLLCMLQNAGSAARYFQELQETLMKGMLSETIPEFQPGQLVGNYRILDRIGRGGMSNVYLAERADGQFELRVAVKCFSPHLIAGIRTDMEKGEQKILARLQHPGIAAVYDAGESSEGIPYFVMEYVEGRPIDRYAKQRSLTTEERLGLFMQVCEAVAHAHSHLTLHLDLKPSNILVRPEGRVKLLDFGIALSMQEAGYGQEIFMGTPAIVAPEQLKGDPLSAATDVYQLGGLLHVLAAGKPADAGAKPEETGITRTGLSEAITAKRIDDSINPELASIIRKCLEPDPAQRYRSIAELIQDIQNYRLRYPISVWRSKRGYRFKKYIARNRTLVAALSLIVITLIAGIILSLWQAGIARTQRDIALKNERVTAATVDFLNDLFMATNPAQSRGDTMTVYKMLQLGYEKVDGYAGSPEIKLELLTTFSNLYRSQGDFSTSGKILEEAQVFALQNHLGLTRSYLYALQQLALHQRDTGRPDSAKVLLNDVLKRHSELGLTQLDSFYTATLKYLSFIYKNLEMYDSATIRIQEALLLEERIWPQKDNINMAETYYILGTIHKDRMELEPAVRYYTRSLDLCERLMGPLFPGTISNLNLVAATLKQAGDYEGALPYNTKARDYALRLYGMGHQETATSIDNLGNTFFMLRQYDSAYRCFRQAMQIRADIYTNRENNYSLTSINNMLSLFAETEQPDSMRKYLPTALVVGASPRIGRRQKALSHKLAGQYHQLTGQSDSALHYFRKSLAENLSLAAVDSARVRDLQAKIEALESEAPSGGALPLPQ